MRLTRLSTLIPRQSLPIANRHPSAHLPGIAGLARGVVALVLLLAVAVLLAPASLAQGEPPTLDEVNAVARELYCPLCNGVRLDTCELQACEQMRQVISDRLAAGASKQQIKDEFVAQYGPIVLGEPPRQGLSLLAWVLPVAALVGGAAWLFYTARRWTQQPAAAEPAESPAAGQPAPQGDTDPYLAQVEADLARLD
jgi:cytochrome c-type biogenesis protein CcmH